MLRSKKTIYKKKNTIILVIVILCIILWCYKMHGSPSTNELNSIINMNNTEFTILSPNITW